MAHQALPRSLRRAQRDLAAGPALRAEQDSAAVTNALRECTSVAIVDRGARADGNDVESIHEGAQCLTGVRPGVGH